MIDYLKMEDDRFKLYLDFVNRVKDIEDEKMAYQAVTPGMPIPNIPDKAIPIASGLRNNEFVNFKLPKDLALVSALSF